MGEIVVGRVLGGMLCEDGFNGGVKRVCVYCGSSLGGREEYGDVGFDLGRLLVERGMGLVYGGACVGVMGKVAEGVLSGGGEVVGVIPKALMKKEVAHEGLTELRVVESMHERKAVMADLADGFIALPGGWGTLEELFEILTWAQLGFHGKPCGILNVAGYYDGLKVFLNHAVEEEFVKPGHQEMLMVEGDGRRLLERMEGYSAPVQEKWIRREET